MSLKRARERRAGKGNLLDLRVHNSQRQSGEGPAKKKKKSDPAGMRSDPFVMRAIWPLAVRGLIHEEQLK